MTENTKNKNGFFIALLTVGLIIASLYIFSPFLKYILVAAVLALSTSHGYNSLITAIDRSETLPAWVRRSRRALVATLFTSFFLMMIFLPLLYFITVTIDQVSALNMSEIRETALSMWNRLTVFMEGVPLLHDLIQRLRSEGTSLINESSIEAIIKGGENMISGVSGLIVQIGWILTFYFLFNIYGNRILHFLATLLPTTIEHEKYLYRECSGTVAVVFYGALFNMVAQGFAFGLLMVFIGGYNSMYLGVLAGFCSIIPIIGAALVYIPIIALELFDRNYINALVILVFAVSVMGFFIDNILRLIFIGYLKRLFGFEYTMNEILILLSILAGIATMGFWGLIIGPSVVALTIASANISRDYLAEEGHTPQIPSD